VLELFVLEILRGRRADFELISSLRLSDEGSRGFWSICWLEIGVLQRDEKRIFPAMRWDQLAMHFLVY
jgi:hypothetical protein